MTIEYARKLLIELREDYDKLQSYVWHAYGLSAQGIVRDWDVFDPDPKRQHEEQQPVRPGIVRLSPNEAWEMARRGVPTIGFEFNPKPEPLP